MFLQNVCGDYSAFKDSVSQITSLSTFHSWWCFRDTFHLLPRLMCQTTSLLIFQVLIPPWYLDHYVWTSSQMLSVAHMICVGWKSLTDSPCTGTITYVLHRRNSSKWHFKISAKWPLDITVSYIKAVFCIFFIIIVIINYNHYDCHYHCHWHYCCCYYHYDY